MSTSPLRVAVLQFAPKLGHVAENIAKARRFCTELQPRTVDLVCLPEMIFTGYVFRDAAHIAPHLERPRTGPTSQFCAELAKRVQCYVLAGYPEKLDPSDLPPPSPNAESTSEQTKVGANSAVLYGPDGEWVGGYRKTNLYDTDMTWAMPGTGFATFSLPPPLGLISLGICMDLNARPSALSTLAPGPYELADHCIAARSRLLILLNAWLDSCEEFDTAEDWYTLNFWAARLTPLWKEKDSDGAEGTEVEKEDTVVIICNRSGEESGFKFAGTSAVFRMHAGSGKPQLLDAMGRREEGIRIWDV